MKSLFGLLGRRRRVASGFHDYGTGELVEVLGINAAQAAAVLSDYHALLDGRPYFADRMNSADLKALTNAALARFGVDRPGAVALATWFGSLDRIIGGREHARNLNIDDKRWKSVCQLGSPDRYPEHVGYDGLPFDAQTGLRTPGGNLFPGALIGCKCMASPIIPGFED